MRYAWCGEHPVLVEDLSSIASDPVIPWEKLVEKRVVVTGATGLIGATLVKALLFRADVFHEKISILACARNLPKAEALFARQSALIGKSLFLVENDVRDPLPENLQADFVIHAASVTASADFTEKPVQTILTTLEGTRNLLDFCLRSKAQAMVFLSSMEIYGKLDHVLVSESDSGYLNPLIIRNSYPQSKRLAEALCAAYAAQYGLRVSVCRLAQTFGPGASPDDKRVFMQFARAVKLGQNIVLHTSGRTTRDYLYTADAARGILSVLLLGEPGEAYNLSNRDSNISILDMAKLCASLNPEHVSVVFDCSEENQKHYLDELHISLDGTRLAALNSFPMVPLRNMFERMLAVTEF